MKINAPKKSIGREIDFTSVADPGCLSRILILPIPDLGSRIQKPQWKEVTLSIQLLDPA